MSHELVLCESKLQSRYPFTAVTHCYGASGVGVDELGCMVKHVYEAPSAEDTC